MKPRPEDLDLVVKILRAIESSKLGKVTEVYLMTRGNLGRFIDYGHLRGILRKYFKKNGYNRKENAHYYEPRKDLRLPSNVPELSMPETAPASLPKLKEKSNWMREWENRQDG
jgi:hypothetical protein